MSRLASPVGSFSTPVGSPSSLVGSPSSMQGFNFSPTPPSPTLIDWNKAQVNNLSNAELKEESICLLLVCSNATLNHSSHNLPHYHLICQIGCILFDFSTTNPPPPQLTSPPRGFSTLPDPSPRTVPPLSWPSS